MQQDTPGTSLEIFAHRLLWLVAQEWFSWAGEMADGVFDTQDPALWRCSRAILTMRKQWKCFNRYLFKLGTGRIWTKIAQSLIYWPMKGWQSWQLLTHCCFDFPTIFVGFCKWQSWAKLSWGLRPNLITLFVWFLKVSLEKTWVHRCLLVTTTW